MIKKLSFILTFLILFSCNSKNNNRKSFNPLENNNKKEILKQVHEVCDLVDMYDITLKKIITIYNKYQDHDKSEIPKSVINNFEQLEMTLEKLEKIGEEKFANYTEEDLENCDNFRSVRINMERLDRIR